MRIESDETRAIISNDLIELKAELKEGKLALALSAMQNESEFIPVLRCTGQNKADGPLRAEIPQDCNLEVDDIGNSAILIIRGSLCQAEFCVNLRIYQDNPWVEVSEVLSLGAKKNTSVIDWFEAVWRFVDWEEPGEVFSPVLVPEVGDVTGRGTSKHPRSCRYPLRSMLVRYTRAPSTCSGLKLA